MYCTHWVNSVCCFVWECVCTCVHVCLCVRTRACERVSEGQVTTSGLVPWICPPFLFFWKRVSHLSGTRQVSWPGHPEAPKDPPVVPRYYMVHAITPDFFFPSGNYLRSPCLEEKHATDWAAIPATSALLYRCLKSPWLVRVIDMLVTFQSLLSSC